MNNVIERPDDMVGSDVQVYLTFPNPKEYPPGSVDPSIDMGDVVDVYGSLNIIEPGYYEILLVGSNDYYIKAKASAS